MSPPPKRHWTEEEWLYCDDADETFVVPRGTSGDVEFLARCNIAKWDAFNWLTYMNGEHPFEMRDEERHNGC